MIDVNQLRNRFVAEQHDRSQALVEKVLAGKCTSFEDYRSSCAELRGIETSTKRFEDLLNKLLGEE